MPICKIYNERGDVVRDFDTDAPHMAGTITVGRSSQCTVSLKGEVDRHVGRVHFSIQREAKVWTITNCSSTGLYKNDQDITNGQIEEGDIVRFGRSFLAFGEKAGPSPYELAFINEEGRQTRLVLWPGRNTIGASSDNTLCIKEMGLSRSHARVIVNAHDMLVEDVASTHGTFLDNAPVTGLTRFEAGAVLRFGKAHCNVLQRGMPLGTAEMKKKGKQQGGRGVGLWIAAAAILMAAAVVAKLLGWL